MAVQALLRRPENLIEEIRGFDVLKLTKAFQRGLCVSSMTIEMSDNGSEIPVFITEKLGNLNGKPASIAQTFLPQAQEVFFEAGYRGIGISQSTLSDGKVVYWMDMVDPNR
jgi:hypothetical protein